MQRSRAISDHRALHVLVYMEGDFPANKQDVRSSVVLMLATVRTSGHVLNHHCVDLWWLVHTHDQIWA